jgi:hypothetical protein
MPFLNTSEGRRKMDLTNLELHFVGSLSSALDSLNRAKALITLAEGNPENARTLAACATIVLSAALEHGVKTRLSEAAEIIAAEGDIPFTRRQLGIWTIRSNPKRAYALCH